MLADSADDVEAIRAAIRRQDDELPGPDVIGQIVTIYDVLPGTPEVQQRKLALIAEIRKLTHDAARRWPTKREASSWRSIDPPPDLRVLTPEDLPPLARRPFTEVDGTVGPGGAGLPRREGISVWNGRDLLRIAAVLQRLHSASPVAARRPSRPRAARWSSRR